MSNVHGEQIRELFELANDAGKIMECLNDRLTKLSFRVAALESPLEVGCSACEDPEALIFDDHPG